MRKVVLTSLRIIGCLTYFIVLSALFLTAIKLRSIFALIIVLLATFGTCKALIDAIKNKKEGADVVFVGVGQFFLSIGLALISWKMLNSVIITSNLASFVIVLILFTLFLYLISKLSGYTVIPSKPLGFIIYKNGKEIK